MTVENGKERLIQSAIRLGAELGIENVTTKRLMKDSGINEAYIYHYFAGKDDLMAQAFLQITGNIAKFVAQAMQPILIKELDRPARNWAMFDACWKYLLEHSDRCQYYCRFRFSALYTPQLHRQRGELWDPVLEAMQPYFSAYGDPYMPINHMIDTALRYASDVAEGVYPDNETTEKRVYQILWAVVDMDIEATK